MKLILNKIHENLFLIIIGFFYYFSFTGLSMGDLYYRCLENGYPLYMINNFGRWPVWLGFDVPHILSIPLLRLLQIMMAKIGLLANPLVLVQIVNLILALGTLKLINSILLKLNVRNSIANAATALFGFSYAFYANMNGEMHHFGIFLFAIVLWLLLDIEKRASLDGRTVFIFCLSFSLIPLFHLENIVYNLIIFLYVFSRSDLRGKFISKPTAVMMGMVLLPLILVGISFVFHFYELGHPPFAQYLRHNHMFYRFTGDVASISSTATGFDIKNIYGVGRAYLEAFSIVSRMLTIIPNYKAVISYANMVSVNLSMVTIFLFLFMFGLINLLLVRYIYKAWRNELSYIKAIIIGLACYLVFSPFLFKGIYLLSEFFIIAVLIHAVLLGYYINSGRKCARVAFYFFVALTIFSNIAFFVYPQKVSQLSIDSLFNNIEAQNKSSAKINIFRVSFFDFPYEIGLRGRFNFFFDEHAYESESSLRSYMGSIKKAYSKHEKVYLVGPAQLFSNSKNSHPGDLVNGEMGKDPMASKYLALFVKKIMQQYNTKITRGYYYNFGTLGQLGELMVVELK